MKKTKLEKGITLIALIITIVVLLILAVVTIGSIRESKIIEHAETAKDTYKEEQIKEEVELFNAEYLLITKRNMQDSAKMIDICKKTGVKPEQLTVYYDVHNANQNKTNGNSIKQEEYVLYRIDKTTEEERTKLEEEGIKALYGDFDLDGYLTYNDVLMMGYYEMYMLGETGREATEMQLKVADIDADGYIGSVDQMILEKILGGYNSYFEYLEMYYNN